VSVQDKSKPSKDYNWTVWCSLPMGTRKFIMVNSLLDFPHTFQILGISVMCVSQVDSVILCCHFHCFLPLTTSLQKSWFVQCNKFLNSQYWFKMNLVAFLRVHLLYMIQKNIDNFQLYCLKICVCKWRGKNESIHVKWDTAMMRHINLLRRG
jgi:hypothetical protein